MAELEGLMIKKRRKQKGYTQLQLCEKIGLSHAPVHQLENGKESISLANLRAICAELGLEVVIREKNENQVIIESNPYKSSNWVHDQFVASRDVSK